jgi:hypothetical protein
MNSSLTNSIELEWQSRLRRAGQNGSLMGLHFFSQNSINTWSIFHFLIKLFFSVANTLYGWFHSGKPEDQAHANELFSGQFKTDSPSDTIIPDQSSNIELAMHLIGDAARLAQVDQLPRVSSHLFTLPKFLNSFHTNF